MIILAKGYTTKFKWQFKKNARLIVVTNHNRTFGKLSCIFSSKIAKSSDAPKQYKQGSIVS